MAKREYIQANKDWLEAKAQEEDVKALPKGIYYILRSQQGELNAVLMYQRLAKVIKTDKEREAFLQLAKEEGRHASVFHTYTKEPLKPKKTMAIIMPLLYRILGKKRLYKLIAKGEYDAAVGYEHLIADFPDVESVKNDEKRHGDIVSGLID